MEHQPVQSAKKHKLGSLYIADGIGTGDGPHHGIENVLMLDGIAVTVKQAEGIAAAAHAAIVIVNLKQCLHFFS